MKCNLSWNQQLLRLTNLPKIKADKLPDFKKNCIQIRDQVCSSRSFFGFLIPRKNTQNIGSDDERNSYFGIGFDWSAFQTHNLDVLIFPSSEGGNLGDQNESLRTEGWQISKNTYVICFVQFRRRLNKYFIAVLSVYILYCHFMNILKTS